MNKLQDLTKNVMNNFLMSNLHVYIYSISGYEYTCFKDLQQEQILNARYMDISGFQPGIFLQHQHQFLINLNASKSQIKQLDQLQMPNLQELDLSHNLLTVLNLDDFILVERLKSLSLSNNSISNLIISSSRLYFKTLQHFDISRSTIKSQDMDRLFSFLKNVQFMNISMIKNAGILKMSKLKNLKSVDLRATLFVSFSDGVFQNLTKLQYVYSSTFKLCCHQVLPKQVR